MSFKDQKSLLNRKRTRSVSLSKKLDITFNQKEIFMSYENINYRTVVTSILENGIYKLYLYCNNVKSSVKFEMELSLDILREKSKSFRICSRLEEAFKVLKNIFNRKKVRIKEKTEENIILNLLVFNLFDFKEENIFFNLKKKGDNTEVINNIEINNNNINIDINNIQKKNSTEKNDNIPTLPNVAPNPENNIPNKRVIKATEKAKENNSMNNCLNFNYTDIEKKINLLFKYDDSKDIKIRNLIIDGGEMLSDCIKIRNEIKELKKFIKLNEKNNENENIENKKNDRISEPENEKTEEKETKHQYIQPYKQKQKIEEKKKIENEIHDIKKSRSVRPNYKKTRFQCCNTVATPPKLVFCENIVDKAYRQYWGDNNFIAFDTMYNDKYLVYGTKKFSIHFYDLKEGKLTKKISKAHEHLITNFRHAYDNIYTRDLLLSVSDAIKNIKVWDVKNMDCLVNIRKAYQDGFLFSACVLIEQQTKMNYIISVNYNQEFLKVFDFEGNIVKSINNAQDKSLLVDTFYDAYKKKSFIIVGNEQHIVSYDFSTNAIYQNYYENNTNSIHITFILYIKGKEVNIIESDTCGYIRIWDFHTGLLNNKCLVGKKVKLRGICLWNQNYLFVGSDDKQIKLIDLPNGVKIDSIKCDNCICTIKKINHPKYGECLLFDEKSNSGVIYLWKKEENSKKI